MNFQLPHWVALVATFVLAPVCMSLAQVPQLAPYSTLLLALAGIFQGTGVTTAIHASSVLHAQNLAAVRNYETRMAAPPKIAERGFVRVGPLLTLLAFGLGALLLFGVRARTSPVPSIGCQGLQAASPQGRTLEQCVSSYVAENVGQAWSAFAVGAGLKCGVDVINVIAAVIVSEDPNLKQYVNEALAALGDPVQVDALRIRLAVRRAARDSGAP